MADALSPTVADAVARFIGARGSKRVFGLSGGHIQPIWDVLSRYGVRVVDVRHEGAAVHMATAHALLTREVGIATVTAGPGVTNCITAIANAHLERVPILVIGGCPPARQDDMGALQETPTLALLRSVTRYARTLRVPEQLLGELEYALTCATGLVGVPGPVYVEIPVDVLRQRIPATAALPEFFDPRDPPVLHPDADSISRGAELLSAARRPLVISGRGAANAGDALRALLEASGALYLDTRDSRDLLPQDFPKVVSAVRSVALAEADLILTVGCRLENIGAEVPPKVTLVRVGRHGEEVHDDRRSDIEILGDPRIALGSLAAALKGRRSMLDSAWAQALSGSHRERLADYLHNLDAAPLGTDGFMEPSRIVAALRRVLRPGAITIVEGGEILDLAQLGLPTTFCLDAEASGCQGACVPFANAAALAFPERMVVAMCEDAAFGRHAVELDTATRHRCRTVVVVANKGKSKIERVGEFLNFGDRALRDDVGRSDFAALARAFGLYGERVTDPGELAGALERAFAQCPALVDVFVTRDRASL